MDVALYALDLGGGQELIAEGKIGRSGLLESPALYASFAEGRYRAVFQIGKYYKNAEVEMPLVDLEQANIALYRDASGRQSWTGGRLDRSGRSSTVAAACPAPRARTLNPLLNAATGIAERTPNGRASYEAVSTTARRDCPEIASGIPRKLGSSAAPTTTAARPSS